MLISEFDPWKSKLCTCPPKLTFNPYTGCDHECVYCYASSYIPRFYNCRPKKDLLRRLGREASKLSGKLISISNSSDPYPNIEEKNGLTRKCLDILSRYECKIQIVTKSPLVTRDIDILKKTRCMVALSITTDDDKISRRLEPCAPVSSERLKAMEALVKNGLPVAVRVDPIIPFLNDKPKRLIESLASLGVSHITSSTYKVRPDNWRRFSKAFPEVAKKLSPLYFEKGERISRYFYLAKELRYQLMEKVKEITEENGMKFGCCREGFSHLNSALCDGSWLVS
ncbi:MAG: radical SAM protein [Candidatus Bathyarchaeota archaeon]|nr:radical SAM protein [Candidatus Bathyarchaeota archaeon]MDH5779578.1 radical SAM protein [Candidatus Bathyarchaeota archaeon]